MAQTLLGGPLDGRGVPRGAHPPYLAVSGRPERGEASGVHVYARNRHGRWVHTTLTARCRCGAFHDRVTDLCTLCGAVLD